jgi:3-hydroxybutyryl-CoA dehydrogenase
MAIYQLSDSKPTTILIPDQSERVAFGIASVLQAAKAPFWIYTEHPGRLAALFPEHLAHSADDFPAVPQIIIDCTWLPNHDALVEDVIEVFPNVPVLFATPCMTSTHLQMMYGSAATIRFNGTPALFPAQNRIELALSLGTAEDVEQYVARYFHLLGFETEVVSDVVGMVTPRVLAMLINEAAFTLQEGIATASDIDTAMKLGTNYPFGPLEWADMIGIDLVLSLLDALYTEYKQERYRACPLLRRFVYAGRYGRLVRHGFYRYDSEGGQYDDDAVLDKAL